MSKDRRPEADMEAKDLVEILASRGMDFYTGIPDSHMEQLCNYLVERFGTSGHHIMPANEGNCAGIAAGYHLATGKVPVIYMQNSGLGNFMNPFVSMLSDRLFGIPCLLIVGWKGEPGRPEQPQHTFQGELTQGTLDLLGIPYAVLEKGLDEAGFAAIIDGFLPVLGSGGCAAILVKSGAVTAEVRTKDQSSELMSREDAIRKIITAAPGDAFVATTGKACRELYELRERLGLPHRNDFLVIGSMGHASSVAQAVALNRPETRVWCLDGDGSALMHLGALASIGSSSPANLIHVILNNGTYDSVGGQPTMAPGIDFIAIAKACGYRECCKVRSPRALDEALASAKASIGPVLLEVVISDGSREDLGWPQVAPKDAKAAFMSFLGKGRPRK